MMWDVYPDHVQAILSDQKSMRSPVQNYHQRPTPTTSLGSGWLDILPALRVRDSSGLGRWATSDLTAEQLPDWYFDLKGRIETLCQHSDGWKGPGSHAPEIDAKRFALEMLRKLALERIPRRPSIGLDFEGTFSFAWLDEDVSVDLTVYGDGTYSFFVSSSKYSTSADEEPIKEPIHSCLLRTLLS